MRVYHARQNVGIRRFLSSPRKPAGAQGVRIRRSSARHGAANLSVRRAQCGSCNWRCAADSLLPQAAILYRDAGAVSAQLAAGVAEPEPARGGG